MKKKMEWKKWQPADENFIAFPKNGNEIWISLYFLHNVRCVMLKYEHYLNKEEKEEEDCMRWKKYGIIV